MKFVLFLAKLNISLVKSSAPSSLKSLEIFSAASRVSKTVLLLILLIISFFSIDLLYASTVFHITSNSFFNKI